jgi:hypothetical protein
MSASARVTSKPRSSRREEAPKNGTAKNEPEDCYPGGVSSGAITCGFQTAPRPWIVRRIIGGKPIAVKFCDIEGGYGICSLMDASRFETKTEALALIQRLRLPPCEVYNTHTGERKAAA